jgi:DNA-binding CsgD family transcriptional regulator
LDLTLIDRIYECAFAPELWPGVLDDLAKIADARGGFLFTANGDVRSWIASASLQAGMERFVAGQFFIRSQRASRAIAARHAGFLREHDLYLDEELATDPIYRDLLWPAGLGWGTATTIPAPTGDVLFLSVERERTRGPVETAVIEQFDRLRPHLARSMLMSARLQLERARVASETLALLGLPALVIDSRGKVLAANDLIEALNAHIVWRAQGRVSLNDRIADALLQQAIETLDREVSASTRSFAVRGTGTDAALIAHVIPIRRCVRDIFAHCAGVLVLTPVTLPQAPPVELVQSLFDLTPAEARVARDLTTGQTVEEIAKDGRVSVPTVRSHVRAVLEKTGCRRQAEAVALLGGISIARG